VVGGDKKWVIFLSIREAVFGNKKNNITKAITSAIRLFRLIQSLCLKALSFARKGSAIKFEGNRRQYISIIIFAWVKFL
jgi:hypothetical protein